MAKSDAMRDSGVRVAPRILAAVALFAPRPHETVLEIGCGTGQAIHTILEREPTVRMVAIDRSLAAVARARIVNRRAIRSGRVRIVPGDIERGPVAPGGFDRIFSIRVNTFWTRPGVALPHAIESVRPGGEVWLIYDAAGPKVARPILESVEALRLTGVRTVDAAAAFAVVITRETVATRT